MAIIDLVRAMAKVEGYGANPNNRPTKNKNPGDVEYHDWMVNKYHVLGSDGRFAIFPNEDEGFKCMVDILSGPSYKNLTLEQIIVKWNDGNAYKAASQSSLQYLKLVCEFTGMKATDIPTQELVNEEVEFTKNITHNIGIVTPQERSIVT
jgi:hypothetical protein